MVVVEGMGDLVDQVIGGFEEAEQTVVDLNANGVQILLQTETAEEEVLHPMII